MRARSAFLTALALPVLLGAGGARAEDKVASPLHMGLAGCYTHATSGNDSWGHCHSIVMFDKDLPLVCFGLNQRPKEKAKYLYVLLFKNAPGKLRGQGVSADVHSNAGRTNEDVRITLGEKAVEIGLEYGADASPSTIKDEVVKVGGTAVKADGPHVFLVDLTQKDVAYRPVQVALPTEVPDMGDAEEKTWPAIMRRAVEQLRQKSSEVNKFLGP